MNYLLLLSVISPDVGTCGAWFCVCCCCFLARVANLLCVIRPGNRLDGGCFCGRTNVDCWLFTTWVLFVRLLELFMCGSGPFWWLLPKFMTLLPLPLLLLLLPPPPPPLPPHVVLALNTLTFALPPLPPQLLPFLLFVGLVKDFERMEAAALLFGNCLCCCLSWWFDCVSTAALTPTVHCVDIVFDATIAWLVVHATTEDKVGIDEELVEVCTTLELPLHWISRVCCAIVSGANRLFTSGVTTKCELPSSPSVRDSFTLLSERPLTHALPVLLRLASASSMSDMVSITK